MILTARRSPCPTDTTIPVTTYALPTIDPTGTARQALHTTTDSVHLVRPDGHLAAVLPHLNATTLTAALRRASGMRTLSTRPV